MVRCDVSVPDERQCTLMYIQSFCLQKVQMWRLQMLCCMVNFNSEFAKFCLSSGYTSVLSVLPPCPWSPASFSRLRGSTHHVDDKQQKRHRKSSQTNHQTINNVMQPGIPCWSWRAYLALPVCPGAVSFSKIQML